MRGLKYLFLYLIYIYLYIYKYIYLYIYKYIYLCKRIGVNILYQRWLVGWTDNKMVDEWIDEDALLKVHLIIRSWAVRVWISKTYIRPYHSFICSFILPFALRFIHPLIHPKSYTMFFHPFIRSMFCSSFHSFNVLSSFHFKNVFIIFSFSFLFIQGVTLLFI